MQFQVPQFINVEDKIFGPLTLKQFVYLAGAGGLCFLIYHFLPLIIALFFIVPVAAFGVALAFYKVNNKPFIFVIESAVKYTLGGKLYIWKKEPKEMTKKATSPAMAEIPLYVPKLSESKLKDLTWSLDIKGNVNPGTEETMRQK